MSERVPQVGDVYVRASGKDDDGVMEPAAAKWESERLSGSPNYRFVCNRGEVLRLLRDNPAVVEMLDVIREGGAFLLEVGEGEEKREVVGLPQGTRLICVDFRDEHMDISACHQADGSWYVLAGHVGGHDSNDGSHGAVRGNFPTAVNAALKGDGDGE